jgi:hypothetical protein
MRKLLLVVPLAVILVLAGFGVAALAGGSTWPVNCASTPNPSSFRCVESYLNALHQKDVTLSERELTLLHTQGSLNDRVSNLEDAVACFRGILPVTQYAGYGYDSNGDKAIDTTTTAIDVTRSGDTVSAYVAIIDPSCIQPSPTGPRFSPSRHPARRTSSSR